MTERNTEEENDMNSEEKNTIEDTVTEKTIKEKTSAETELTGMEVQKEKDRAGHTGEQSGFSREQWILTHIGDENLMEYLCMEQRKEEEIRKAKDTRQKRLLSAFQLAVSLAAVITVMFLLRDNPTIMVNILYIIAIIAALWIWKNPRS